MNTLLRCEESISVNSFLLILLLLLASFSCTESRKPLITPNNLANKNHAPSQLSDSIIPVRSSVPSTGVPFPAGGKRIHPDSAVPPRVVPLKDPPTVLPAFNNIREAGAPRVAPIPEQLTIITPGENGVPLPASISVQPRRTLVFKPKPVPALPPRIKDEAIYDIQYLDVDQGLMSSYVNFLLEDSSGTMWFATSYGVSSYDGKHFINYTTEEGLMDNSVGVMLEDSRKNIWFGTSNGISCYDGHHFIHYPVKTSSGSYEVKQILEDKDGNLWFGTSKGVLFYSPTDGKQSTSVNFKRWTTREGLIDNHIMSILEDRRGHLWFGTASGACRYQPGGAFTHYTSEEGLTDNWVRSIEEDARGRLWFGTNEGIYCHDPGNKDEPSKGIAQFTTEEGLFGNKVPYILKDSRNNLWLAGEQGVSRYDGRHFIHFSEEQGLSNNSVRHILEDKQGNIWLSTGGDGVYRLRLDGFNHFSADKTLSNSDFTAISEDRQGNLWFGTEGAAILYNAPTNFSENMPGSFIYYTPREGLIHPEVLSIMGDSRGKVWIGTSEGVSCFDGTVFTQYTTEQGLISNEVKSFMEDSRGGIWFVTTSGVSRLDSIGMIQFTTEGGLISNTVRCLVEDRRGDIWIGTSEGVSRYRPPEKYHSGQTGQFIHYTTKEGLAGNDIRAMLEDRRGNLWFGTRGNGLNYVHPDQELLSDDPLRIIHYTTQHGLSNNVIWSLQEDKQGNIWVSTEKGITVIPPLAAEASAEPGVSKRPFFTFGKEEGLKRVDFQSNSAHLDHQNRIWWGALSCVSMLDLDEFQFPTDPLQNVRLTDIEVNQQFIDYRRLSRKAYRDQLKFGQDLLASFDSVIAFANYPASMTLPHYLNHLTFHFSAIDWAQPAKVRYQYMMEGIDESWSQPVEEPTVDYRNLSHGRYTFKVRTGGEASIWSTPFKYSFVIRPPWWQTGGAYFGYFLIAAGGIYLIFYFLKKRWMLRAALEREQEEAARLKELDALKTRFFTNVSHELRTPLTLLLGPISSLLKEKQLTDKQNRLLRMARKSGEQLEQLVTEILDLGKLEMGKMELNETPTRLYPFFRRHLAQFESLAEGRKIDFSFESAEEDHLVVLIDRAKCRQILYNLLSNAFKFTPAGGWIKVGLSIDKSVLHLTVADSGAGIHPDDLPHLYDRFYQTMRRDKPARGGTGIGLALCYEYVQLFGGSIEVDSTLDEGSVFRVTFPISLAASSTEQENEIDIPVALPGEGLPPTAHNYLVQKKPEKPASAPSRPTILVVEDNPDLQEYLRLILAKKYRVLVADNGQKALDILTGASSRISTIKEKLRASSEEQARQTTHTDVALILSDLMMPVMDGYQFLERLKSRDNIRHLPVIMLTARADVRDKLKALRIGVDDYLIKPFNEEELLVRIDNLLKNQANRSQQTAEETEPGAIGSMLSEPDQAWLASLESYVRENLSDNTLSVPLLAQEFAMSESTLLRQIKRLTGLTPVQYLQEIRLDRARRLLENRTHRTVSKVATVVGYGDARSFSRSFKKRFGKLPSDFLGD